MAQDPDQPDQNDKTAEPPARARTARSGKERASARAQHDETGVIAPAEAPAIASAPDAASEPSLTPEAQTPAEEPVAEAAAPPAPQPMTSPKLGPAIIGLVAGIIGGFGAVAGSRHLDFSALQAMLPPTLSGLVPSQTAPSTGLAPSEDVSARIARTETALAEAARRDAALAADIAALKARPAAPAASAIPEALAERLKGVDMLGAKVQALEALAAKPAASPDEMRALKADIARLGAQSALTKAAARFASATLAEAALRRGEALGPALSALQKLDAPQEALAALAPFTNAGAKPASALLAGLKSLARESEPKPAEPAPDFWARLQARAASLIEMRKTDLKNGTDDTSLIARAEQALLKGDLVSAQEALKALSPARAPVFGAFQAEIEAQIKAGAAIAALQADALAGFAKESSGLAP